MVNQLKAQRVDAVDTGGVRGSRPARGTLHVDYVYRVACRFLRNCDETLGVARTFALNYRVDDALLGSLIATSTFSNVYKARLRTQRGDVPVKCICTPATKRAACEGLVANSSTG